MHSKVLLSKAIPLTPKPETLLNKHCVVAICNTHKSWSSAFTGINRSIDWQQQVHHRYHDCDADKAAVSTASVAKSAVYPGRRRHSHLHTRELTALCYSKLG